MKQVRTKEEYIEAANNSYSIAGMLRILGLKPCGGNYKILHKAIETYDIDISHFTGQGWNVGLKFVPKQQKKIEEILTENSYYQSFKLKIRLFKEHLKEENVNAVDLLNGEVKKYHWNYIIRMVLQPITDWKTLKFCVLIVTHKLTITEV